MDHFSPQQREVVLEGLGIELGVARHDLHLAVLERVGLEVLVIQVVLAHPQQQLVRIHAERGEIVLHR